MKCSAGGGFDSKSGARGMSEVGPVRGRESFGFAQDRLHASPLAKSRLSRAKSREVKRGIYC